jgi:WD40 repeat protein
MDGSLHLVWSPDGRYLIGATRHEPIVIWKVQTGEQVRSVGGHEGEVRGLAWSPDGGQLAAATDGGKVVVWNPQTGKELQSFEETSGRGFVVAWSPDGSRLAAGGAGSATIWDVRTGERLEVFMAEGAPAEGEGPRFDAMAWSPDGSRLAFRAGTGTVEVWDIATGERVLRLDSPGPNREGLAWSVDGKILTADAWLDGNVVSLWDAQTGELLQRREGVRYAVRSPIDDSLASVVGDYGRDEDKLILWNVGTEEPEAGSRPGTPSTVWPGRRMQAWWPARARAATWSCGMPAIAASSIDGRPTRISCRRWLGHPMGTWSPAAPGTAP